jgi:hypothetical protein
MALPADTAGSIINLALFISGVYGASQPPSAFDANTGLTLCNYMLDGWSAGGWMMYHTVESIYQSTGAASYTIGVGGNFNTPRPNQLENGCFARQTVVGSPLYNIDYPLEVMNAREDYAAISIKNLGSFPLYVFFDGNYSSSKLGNVFIWPIPSNLYEIHLLVREQLTQFTSLAQTVNFPPGYREALLYNLAARLRLAYRKGPDPALDNMAKSSLSTVMVSNTQIPRMKIPQPLIQSGVYNVYSDNN